jgi:hypothetical protein
MPGLVPGIHVLAAQMQERRGWPGNKPGHDELKALFHWLHFESDSQDEVEFAAAAGLALKLL